MPEMLWESADAVVELRRRFGFGSTDAATTWAVQLLAEDYGLTTVSLDRMVISSHNLMVWVTVEDAGRLMIKVCRLSEAHGLLTRRGALVRWLAGLTCRLRHRCRAVAVIISCCATGGRSACSLSSPVIC